MTTARNRLIDHVRSRQRERARVERHTVGEIVETPSPDFDAVSAKAGQWPTDVLGPAWIACRDAYALEDYGSSFVIAGEMPRANCFAESGWLLALLWPRPFSDPTFAALNDQCRT